MKLQNLLLPMLTAAALALPGCYSYKPLGTTSAPDYNRRVEVKDAKLVKRGNFVDFTFNIGLAGAGGYMGYTKLDMVQHQTAAGREAIKPANAAIGVLAGASAAYIMDQIAGRGKVQRQVDPKKWVRKANSDFKYLNGTSSQFTMIHESAEQNFQVKNIVDVRDFKTAFGSYSSYEDNVFKLGMANLARADLPELMATFPSNKNLREAKVKYIETAASYTEAAAALRRYPLSDYNGEALCLRMIVAVDDAVAFLREYPQSASKKVAMASAFTNEVPSASDMQRLKNAYGQNFYLTGSDDLSKVKDVAKQNYFKGMYTLENPRTVTQFDDFNRRYTWMKYSGKNVDMLSRYWDFVEPRYATGKEVLSQFGSIVANPVYATASFTKEELAQVIATRMKAEAEKNVKVVSVNTIGAENPDWERWKQYHYTAMAVHSEDDVVYVLYGEVQNNSKFDLPVVVGAGGVLQATTKPRISNSSLAKGAKIIGEGYKVLGNLLGMPEVGMAMDALEKGIKKDIDAKVEYYYFSSIPAHEKYAYAVRLDFGNRTTTAGLSVFLSNLRVEYTLALSETKAETRYHAGSISDEQIRKQKVWNLLAKHGLPNSHLRDDMLGGNFSQDGYDFAVDLAWKTYVAVGSVVAAANAYANSGGGGESSVSAGSNSGGSAASEPEIKRSRYNAGSSGKWADAGACGVPGCTEYSYRNITFEDGTTGTIRKQVISGKTFYYPDGYSSDITSQISEDRAIEILNVEKHNEYSDFNKYMKKHNWK
jgi:hypothetical protein